MTGLAAALRGYLARAAARDAARDGDLDTAARLLDGHDCPAALDLLARVHAQRGDLDAADRCWALVLAALPGDPAATGGRATIAAIRSGALSERPGRFGDPVAQTWRRRVARLAARRPGRVMSLFR